MVLVLVLVLMLLFYHSFFWRRYASMQGDVEAHRQRVRLQLCATTAISHAGKAFWSDPVQLDALGGAAVVEAPCPMTAVTPNLKEAQAGYRLAVTAVQV